MSAVPAFTTPEDLARSAGWSPRKVREIARGLGACRIIGNRMVLRDCDVVLILKAAKPTLTLEDVKSWISEDAAELIKEGEAQEWQPATGVVYFIARNNEAKIGYTTDLKRRLYNFRTATTEPLRLLGTIPGTIKLEAYFHEKFAPFHIEREWFRLTDVIAEFIARRQF